VNERVGVERDVFVCKFDCIVSSTCECVCVCVCVYLCMRGWVGVNRYISVFVLLHQQVYLKLDIAILHCKSFKFFIPVLKKILFPHLVLFVKPSMHYQ